MPLALLLLWLIPIAVAFASKRRASGHVFRNTGIALGLVVSPATLGLYGLYFLGPVSALIGIVALPLTIFHGSPGYELAIHFGLIPTRTVVEGTMHIPVEALNSVVWSLVYGVLGWCIDRWHSSRRSAATGAA